MVILKTEEITDLGEGAAGSKTNDITTLLKENFPSNSIISLPITDSSITDPSRIKQSIKSLSHLSDNSTLVIPFDNTSLKKRW